MGKARNLARLIVDSGGAVSSDNLTNVPAPSWSSLSGKPTTVSGFGITDMASQSVANATNVTNVTTAQVLSATAAASVGAVGTYATMTNYSGPRPANAGTTAAGSTLRYGSGALAGTGTPSGTWRCMGYQAGNFNYDGYEGAATWLRIA